MEGVMQTRRRQQREGLKSIRYNKQTTLHMHYTFWYMSLPSLHDNEVNLPNNTFYESQTQRDDFFSSFPNLVRKICPPQSRRSSYRKDVWNAGIFREAFFIIVILFCVVAVVVAGTLLFYSLIACVASVSVSGLGAKNEERESKMAPINFVSFLSRPKPRIPFLGLSLLRNQTETLAVRRLTRSFLYS